MTRPTLKDYDSYVAYALALEQYIALSAYYFQIGGYRLAHTDTGISIYRKGGEGGVFNAAELEAAIDKFYAEKF